MTVRDTILTVNIVEPALVSAVKKLSSEMGYELKGLVLIDKVYSEEARERDFSRDKTGLFTEIICDFDNYDEMQKVLKPYTDRILAVTCRHETSMRHFRKLIPLIPYVPVPSESSILWSTEKSLMRDRLSSYDQSLTPRYQYMEKSDIPKVAELTKDFDFPVIVKPGGLADSLLVTKCETLDDLKDCLDNTFKIIGKVYADLHRKVTPSVMVEEMMQGDMYSIDAYVSSDGEISCLPLIKVITAHSIGLPGFHTYQTVVPTGISNEEQEKAFIAARSSIRALNLRAVTTHIELFLTPDGWKIVELGARIGGHRAALYGEVYGIDHFYNDLAIRMNKKPIMPGEPVRHAAGFTRYADEEGVIESIEGFEEARKLESVVFLTAKSAPGDVALFAHNGGRYIYDGILSNKNLEQLNKDVAKVRELIKINIRKDK